MPSKFTTTYSVMRSNNKARISALAASTHASRSNFTRSPFHLAVGDLGSRLSNNCDTVLDVEIREPISDHNIITFKANVTQSLSKEIL